MANRWSGLTIDCHDVERVAAFWSALLKRQPGPSRPGWVYLGHPGDTLPRLVFQQVPERKTGKNRLHLDVQVDDLDAGVAEVVHLGGSETGERHQYDAGVVVVVKDVEGNEFCLVHMHEPRVVVESASTRGPVAGTASVDPMGARGVPGDEAHAERAPDDPPTRSSR